MSKQVSRNPIARFFRPNQFQEYFRVLADSLPEAVFVISSDGHQMVICNHAFLLLSGYARAEIPDLSPSDLFPDAAGEQALGRILDCWQNRGCELDAIPLRGRDGSITLVDLHVFPAGPQGSDLVVLASTTSKRLQARTKAKAEGERLEVLSALTASLMQGEVEILGECLKLARRLLSASHFALYRASAAEPAFSLLGELPDAFPRTLGATDLSLASDVDVWMMGQRPDAPLPKAARASKMELLHVARLGAPPACIGICMAAWFDKDQAPQDAQSLMVLVANLFHTVLQLENTRQAIADLEQLQTDLEAEISDLAAASTDALIGLDEDLNVVWTNAAAQVMLGYRPGEMDRMPIKDVVVGPESAIATLLDALGHQRASERSHLTIHRRDGTPFPVHLRALPASGAGRARLLVTLIDQSERQAIEAETELLAQRALLGEVAAIFAHEVRNPINNISTGVQLVSSRLGKEHPLTSSLERIRNECTRLSQLMSDVLFFARPLELKIIPMDLSELIERLLVRWGPRFKQVGVEPFTSFAPDTPKALIDPRTFEQVVVNLITNGLQAMGDGGTLSISLEASQASNGRTVDLKIADSGTGIPVDIKDRIFDPFFTTKKEGTGLGLAIARRILSAHKGVIMVESYPDAGTVFTLRVPAEEKTDEG